MYQEVPHTRVAKGLCRPTDCRIVVAPMHRMALSRASVSIWIAVNCSSAVISDYKRKNAQDWRPFSSKQYIETANTKVPAKELKRLGLKLAELPEGFVPHSRVKKIIDDRRAMAEGKLPVDWGMGENLAYATLLAEGYGIRISGEDVGRGTFFHRHATIHDQNRESWDAGSYQPLAHLQADQGSFQCYESVLSVESVLAFEYGYATAEPNQLVVWEAQFGDFVNGAQVVVDQFIASGETKWGRGCGLVMLLPHGYEGQGPEHSSARPERFIQLCAEMNMEVCVPSNASQIYHVLRRQMVRKQRKPLVIMSPKSLLRNKDASCSMDELSKGEFQRVIGEVDDLNPAKVTRVILCSGKVYYDLLNARREQKITSPSSVSNNSIRSRKSRSRTNWRSSRRPPKSSGARKSRVTRVSGTGSLPVSIWPVRWVRNNTCSSCHVRQLHRQPWAIWPSTMSNTKL
jgi:2-oxoglutarate dehydrogenase E1 component